MPRKEEDSLDQDFTRTGEQESPKPPESQRSLGDQSTYGDAGSSVSDVGGLDDTLDSDMEVVDLSDRYEIAGVIGKGGMGEVLRARDKRLNRPVAIKRILGQMARSKKALSRFLTEAQSVAKLNHFSIVQIYDYGRAADGPFIIMELVEGQSLQEKLKEGPLDLQAAVDMTCQLCDALSVAHEAGITHRDIKPANILLTGRGEPKLTDFGLARQDTADHGQTMAGAVLGTIDFMPPEQRRDATQTDARSDLWSLAATLYQMVTGKSPKIIRFNNVPQALQDVLGKALEDEKDDRYQTAAEFRDALRTSLKDGEPEVILDVELGMGECPQCHTKNESSRKFCRECAAPLRVNCLSCEREFPVWDKVCGECGAKQPELVAARRAELDAQRAEAESLLSQYAFSDSLRIAKEVAAVEDIRLQHLKEWAEGFITSTTEEENRQQQSAADHYTEAQTHRASYDYKSAIHAIESIPEAVRTSQMSSYLQQLQSDHADSEELIRTISDRLKRRDFVGLLEQVNRAIELRGDRADLPKLKIQLEQRHEKLIRHRDEAFQASEKLFAEGKAKEALARVERIDSTVLRPDDTEHLSRLRHIVEEQTKLYALVAECKEDGVIDPAEVDRMLSAAITYLELNPGHTKVLALCGQLLERIISRTPDQYVSVLAKLPLSLLENLPSSIWEKLPGSILEKIQAKTTLNLQPRDNTIGMQLKLIPAGEFQMGSPASEADRYDNETQHLVKITQPFYLSVHEVTQQQYQQVMGNNPSIIKGANKPVTDVSWNDAVRFCEELSKREGVEYRLPTEAEWEYACRAGTTTDYSCGDAGSWLAKYAWYDLNSGRTTHPVGEKRPNPWGLYDIHGNVMEWCQDWHGPYERERVLIDPTGPASGSNRVLRGGSSLARPRYVRSAHRASSPPDLRSPAYGFRLARTYNPSP